MFSDVAPLFWLGGDHKQDASDRLFKVRRRFQIRKHRNSLTMQSAPRRRRPNPVALASTLRTVLSAHEACAQVPTFVITSSLYDQDVAQSYQLGASAVLSKPLSRASLREELVRIGSLAPNSSRVCTTSH